MTPTRIVGVLAVAAAVAGTMLAGVFAWQTAAGVDTTPIVDTEPPSDPRSGPTGPPGPPGPPGAAGPPVPAANPDRGR